MKMMRKSFLQLKHFAGLKSLFRYIAVVIFCVHFSSFAQQENSESRIPTLVTPSHTHVDLSDYTSTPGVYGTVTSVGSDTLAGLMAIWAQRFQELYPHVKFQIQATGSATASQALTQGIATIGPMSRALSNQEIANFTRVHNYPPTALIVAIDAIALYVERNNPLSQLTLAEVDALFSATRLCGGKQALKFWQQLDVNKFGENRGVQLFGRNSASGTYDLFKQKALCNGDYLRSVNEMPSSSSVVQSVASSVGAIGYAALGYQNNNVKTLALSENGETYYTPSPANLRDGKYPFTRFLYIIVNKAPNASLATLERTFLRFILSAEGQAIVEDNGYFSVSERVINRQNSLLSDQPVILLPSQ